ncbi:hypothetical protein K9L67_03780 [Candidatus Woesearchaeota archaeon]|nr:hypothetical protein [Candidatus Woesearchaeota archaeon]MCF7901322.1 hypothetical protein [Candidatus Woesearchaeota archaeon]MCF8013996.1 hypothetical protein [Candidatus Woesearchaeota archaeon]
MENYFINDKTVKVYLDNDEFSDSLNLLLELDKIYKTLGGDQLLIKNVKEFIEIKVTESEYDANKETKFSNINFIKKESIFSKYASREIVEETIDNFFKSEKTREIKDKLNSKFPEKLFYQDYPYIATLSILFNEYNKKEYLKETLSD